ncbi:S8 family serine peptidase [Shewanella schlegeliana]|uniref:S8 family serine peptidase n=2 Tax=Shewanella schlegeliana TaxID=190308 RepID=A0ABS1SVB6_9GAMM|nr:S8 family serine peptidase [Shewanella schlegeliana]
MYKGGSSSFTATTPTKKGQKVDLHSAEAKSYASHLVQEQNKFASALSQISANSVVERQFQTLFNGVTIAGQGLSIEQLMAIPGVKAVYPEAMYEINMDASLEVINSQAMWTAVEGMENAGKGIRVAVIDGGIRPENPMFADDGFDAPTGAMPTDDYCSTVDTTFCNNKLIVARWSQPTFPVCADEYMSPLGFGGHGTHVAGTAVGNKVNTTFKDVDVELSGVAPAAYLMSYKALYSKADCSGGSGSNIMLMEALEHAVNDGADVINNSWGGGAGGDPANSPYKTMFEAAEAAGIVVVTAAGNDGNGAKTIGCPACIESGISVANSTTGRFFANSFNAGGEDLLAIEGNNGLLEADIALPIIASINVNSDNFEGCTAFDADAFKGSIALISRGSCSFADKAANAQAAGAEAMVVYNNKPGAPISMYMPDATLASVMISQEDGEGILDSEVSSGTISAEVKRIVAQSLADTIAASSSRGPNGNENILKPDLAAPGTNILSAYSPDDGGEDFNMISGTSMASPHVAGAAALMTQLHPEWSANDIKTALTSTAKMDGILDDDAVTPASPFAMGAGRMDLDAAAKAVLTFDKPSIAADSCVGPCTFTRTVYNKSDEKTAWTLSASTDSAGITVSPTSLELEAGASATFTVTVDSTFTEYGSWIFGNVMIKSDEGKQDAHLPLAVMAKESSDSSLISTMTSATDIEASDKFPIKAVVNNTVFQNTVTVTAFAPEGTKLTSADDVVITPTGATENGRDVNEELGMITWVGKLNLPKMGTTTGTGTFPSIFDLDLAYVPACNNGCDEKSFTFNTPEYKYNGATYSQITISDNGIALVGGGSTSGTWNNKELPDSANPNNILAPFWSDFDLSDGSETDTGGGQLGIQFVNTGTDVWIVVEWKDAQLYDDASGDKYSFSTWIRTGDNETVSFNYFAVPNMPANLTIGAENIGGTVGTTYHYNGEGNSVATNDFVDLTNTAAGSVEINYMVESTTFNAGHTDMVEVEEEGTAEFNVLDNDIGGQKVARASVTGDGMTAHAQRLIDIVPAGKLGMVKIVDEPSNGEATVSDDGTVTYTPNVDFFGEDSFSYTSQDEKENTNEATQVHIAVTNVNDAPTVSPSGMTSTEGFVVTAKANGQDVDGDNLTYTWEQTAGTDVEFTNGGESISFTAPQGAQDLVFSVIASDGELSSETATATISVTAKEEKSSGGSLGWLALVLLPFAGLRRRNK